MANGPLNWTQEHKSVWYGPPSKSTRYARRPARVAFLQIGNFAPISEILHIKGQIFLGVFIRSRLHMTPIYIYEQ